MSSAVVVALVALTGATLTGVLTYLASRRTTDDSRAIGLINAGQVALEAALARTTAEVLESERRRSRDAAEHKRQIAALREELTAVRNELRRVLKLHADCERQRARDATELERLRRGAL